MAASKEFREFVADQLSGLGPVTVRSMFGGAGIFLDGLMFALIADDVLYFKVDDRTRERYDAEGLGAFAYNKGGRVLRMSYHEIPDRLYDDPAEMADWARDAHETARRAKAGG